jgi:murein DD-endopeptidase MepM/ murein hydrolase activator NlpD
MKLHEPIPNFKPKAYPEGDVTQFFGENPKLYAQFGTDGHNGWDITRAYGTPIYAVQDGRVVDRREDSGGNGKHVRIFGPEGEWIYGHLSRIDVELNQQITAGQQIGLMGNTGFVVSGATPYWEHNPYAGTHLHLSFYPGKLWNGEKTWDKVYPSGDRAIMTDPDNGFNGAVDFSFDEAITVSTLLISDRVALLAKDKENAGDTKTALMLWAVVQLLKAFGN